MINRTKETKEVEVETGNLKAETTEQVNTGVKALPLEGSGKADDQEDRQIDEASGLSELREMMLKMQETVQDLTTDVLYRVYEQGLNASETGKSPAFQEGDHRDTASLQAELNALKKQLQEKDLKEQVLTQASKFDLNGSVLYSYLKGSYEYAQDPATGSFMVVGSDNRSTPLDRFIEKFASTAEGKQLALPKPPPPTGLNRSLEATPAIKSSRDILARIFPDKAG